MPAALHRSTALLDVEIALYVCFNVRVAIWKSSRLVLRVSNLLHLCCSKYNLVIGYPASSTLENNVKIVENAVFSMFLRSQSRGKVATLQL